VEIARPYLLFLGDAPDSLAAKTAAGICQWRPDVCTGQLRLPGCAADLGLPDLAVPDAAAHGARTLLIGVANRGGVIPQGWVPTIVEALAAGMDVASGLHTRLDSIPEIADAARRYGGCLHEARHPEGPFNIATGVARPGHRLLTVGTDCSVGKMYAALALERELSARGVSADFRATGQTGILIAGSGVSVDAVVADFIAGATESLCPANAADHWDVVEGQGSLFHPSFAGVSLGLLHGAQPTELVLCHEPVREHMRGLPGRPLPQLRDCLETNLAMARVVSPQVRFVGVAVNTAALSESEADDVLSAIQAETLLPSVDPVRTGVGAIIDGLL
jgi:uncharacterized NAD-dependent epimerase/dehydratase family protein